MPWPSLALPRRWQPPAPAWRRRAQWGAVLLAVALAHAWLIHPVQRAPGRAPPRLPAMQVVALAPAAAPPQAEPAPPAPAPTPAPTRVAAEPAPVQGTDEPIPGDERPVDPHVGPRPQEAVAGTVVTPADIREPFVPPTPALVADAVAAEAARAASQAAGELPALPPPVYQTVLPRTGFRLAFRVEQGDLGGQGQLRVELPPEGGYRATLQAVAGDRVVADWVSTGQFDAAGVAPERVVERLQRGRGAQAVNFQRDKQLVTFSSSTRALLLMAGAQDRASLLLQLMAIARAQPGGLQAGQALRLQVASARGLASEWRFEVAGEEWVEPAGERLATLRLVREPTQPYDQRVEVWLARSAGHLPVGLRLTTVPGKEPVSLWLDGPLPAAEAMP